MIWKEELRQEADRKQREIDKLTLQLAGAERAGEAAAGTRQALQAMVGLDATSYLVFLQLSKKILF